MFDLGTQAARRYKVGHEPIVINGVTTPYKCQKYMGTWMSQEVRINGLQPTYKWGIPWGYNPLILTFDPNFLGHPSKWSYHPIYGSYNSIYNWFSGAHLVGDSSFFRKC